jgi:hypothetical protein
MHKRVDRQGGTGKVVKLSLYVVKLSKCKPSTSPSHRPDHKGKTLWILWQDTIVDK